MTLRIAHVTATFPPYPGGTGNVCYHNARVLAQRGHEVHVFTGALPGVVRYEVDDEITINRLKPLLQIGNAPVLPGLLPLLRGFDLIHLHYPFFGGEITGLAARLHQTPLIITYHQDVILKGLLGVVEKIQRLTVGRLMLRTATRLLFTSLDYGHVSCVRDLLKGREHTLDELPNGVDVTKFNPRNSAADLRIRHHLAPNDQIALLVAGLDRAHYFKGVNVFLEALARLPEKVKGVIVGDGALRPTYEAAAAELGIKSRLIFAGRVSDEDLGRYYRLADVTVLPSVTMGEAFGLVLLESMASATPVIASNLPGVRTVVDHGFDGLLVEPKNPVVLAEALRQILQDDSARQALGWRGRAKVEARYTWEKIGVRLEEIYQQALNQVETPSFLNYEVRHEP